MWFGCVGGGLGALVCVWISDLSVGLNFGS